MAMKARAATASPGADFAGHDLTAAAPCAGDGQRRLQYLVIQTNYKHFCSFSEPYINSCNADSAAAVAPRKHMRWGAAGAM